MAEHRSITFPSETSRRRYFFFACDLSDVYKKYLSYQMSIIQCLTIIFCFCIFLSFFNECVTVIFVHPITGMNVRKGNGDYAKEG